MTESRVLIINQCFYPDVAATAQHAWDLARELNSRGYRVSAIASRSVYGQRGAQLAAAETVAGIKIHRVGSSWFGKGSIVGRIFDFAAFYVLAAWKALTISRQNVVICLSTPPFIVLVGIVLRAIRGGKVVYWVMDLYPDLPITCGVLAPTSPFAMLLEAVHRWCLRPVSYTHLTLPTILRV